MLAKPNNYNLAFSLVNWYPNSDCWYRVSYSALHANTWRKLVLESDICFPMVVHAEQRSPHAKSTGEERRLRNSQNSGNSHGPCLEAETTGDANGSAAANRGQQEDDIIEI